MRPVMSPRERGVVKMGESEDGSITDELTTSHQKLDKNDSYRCQTLKTEKFVI